MVLFLGALVNFHWTGHIYKYIEYLHFFIGRSSFQIPMLCCQLEKTSPLLEESLRGVNLACFHFCSQKCSCELALNINYFHSNLDLISFDPPRHFTHTHTRFSERLPRSLEDACQNMLQHQVFCFFPMYHCGDSARWTHREKANSQRCRTKLEKLHDARVFLENNRLKLYGVGLRVILGHFSSSFTSVEEEKVFVRLHVMNVKP